MRFTVVTTWPRPRSYRSDGARRVVATVSGAALLVGAAVVAVLATYSTAYPVLSPWLHHGRPLGEFHDRPATPLDAVGIPAVLQLVLAAGCFAAGRELVRGRRYVVLFLRRFGHRESTEAVVAAARRIGRRWRFVTLDDASIASVGAGSASRAVSAALVRAGTAADAARRAGAALAGLLERPGRAVVSWYHDRRDGLVALWRWTATGAAVAMALSAGAHIVRTRDWAAVDTMFDVGATWYVETYVFAGGLAVLAVAVLPLGVAFLGFLLVLLMYPAAATIGNGATEVLGAMAGAEERRRAVLTSTEDLAAAREQLQQERNRVFRPRLTVIAVHTPLWRRAVLAAAPPRRRGGGMTRRPGVRAYALATSRFGSTHPGRGKWQV